MTSILRMYDPAQCGEHGVPLDWKRCRTCGGDGCSAREGHVVDVRDGVEVAAETCPICDGHGSLKAAALAEVARVERPFTEVPPVRCEGCGHPMSDGTWEPSPLDLAREAWLELDFTEWLCHWLRKGIEPERNPYRQPLPVHYSPCDEACRHMVGGHVAGDRVRDGINVSASWRSVDVRTLGWPHDLRPEKLAVLCLRCYATGVDR